MQTSLHGIAQAARENRQKRFRSLYSCFNRVVLEQSFRELNKNAAAGVDGVTYGEYEQSLESNLADLEDRLKGKRYRARLIRRKFIPKANGGQRPLGIPGSWKTSFTWPQFSRLWNAYNVSSLRSLNDRGQQTSLLPDLR